MKYFLLGLTLGLCGAYFWLKHKENKKEENDDIFKIIGKHPCSTP